MVTGITIGIAASSLTAAAALPSFTGPFTDDSDTTILLHLNNNTTDDNSSGRTAVTDIAVHGTQNFSTVGAKFGSHSHRGGGIPGGLTNNTVDAAAFDLGTNDFCVEFWIKPVASTNVDQYAMSTFRNFDWTLFINFDTGFTGFGRANLAWDVSTTTSYTAGTWYHMAFVRDGGNMYIYRDGTEIASSSGKGSVDFPLLYWKPSYGGNGPSGDYVSKDEFRISIGVPRYTGEFIIN